MSRRYIDADFASWLDLPQYPVEVEEFLAGNEAYRNEEKKLFEEGHIDAPDLDYPYLQEIASELPEWREELLAALQKVSGIYSGEYRKEVVAAAWLHRAAVVESLTKVEMLTSALEGDSHAFLENSSQLYGQPSWDAVQYSLFRTWSAVNCGCKSLSWRVVELARELSDLLPSSMLCINPFQFPSGERLEEVRARIVEEMGFDLNPDTIKQLGAEDIREACLRVMHSWPSEAMEGWEVEISADRAGISLNHAQRKVFIPQGETSTEAELQGTVAHEIHTHLRRRVNGSQSVLRLLGFGLAGYLAAEEGIATVRQQCAEGGDIDEYLHWERCLAIVLACGCLCAARNFREVYEIMYRVYFLKKVLVGMPEDEAQHWAKEQAWKTCVRTFRGTDCKTPGACYTKDWVYLEGNMNMWQWMLANPDRWDELDIGKYDPTNSEHVQALQTLGILKGG